MITTTEKYRAVVHGKDDQVVLTMPWSDGYVKVQHDGIAAAQAGQSVSIEKRIFIEENNAAT